MENSNDQTVKEKATLNQEAGLQRRKILGWMGLGLIGAFAINALPLRLISKRAARKKESKISINALAVRRNKKATSPKDLRGNG